MAKKLLIVDDKPHTVLLLEQTLEELENNDIEILTATNRPKVLETIRSENPNLIFLDVMMPKMNGYESCADIYMTKPSDSHEILEKSCKILGMEA